MRNRGYYRDNFQQYREQKQKNRVVFGVLLVVVGLGLMLRTMGLLPYFSFDLSWPVLLIIVGALIGIKNNFRNNAWWIMILIGIVNLTPQFMIMGKPSRQFVWPAMITLIGIAMVLRPRRSRDNCYPRPMVNSITNDNTVNIDVTFGGRKEIVTAKEFNGGNVNVTFAGCELNLTQADFTVPSVVLDCRVSFGGIEIIVPSHWEVVNDISPSFGSVEDERTIQTNAAGDVKKTLILRGNCSFGSIELKSY